MDLHYLESIRELPVNIPYLFHTKTRYSELFGCLCEEIEGHVYHLLYDRRIDL